MPKKKSKVVQIRLEFDPKVWRELKKVFGDKRLRELMKMGALERVLRYLARG